MARSLYIYVLQDHVGTVLGAWTVKREMIGGIQFHGWKPVVKAGEARVRRVRDGRVEGDSHTYTFEELWPND